MQYEHNYECCTLSINCRFYCWLIFLVCLTYCLRRIVPNEMHERVKTMYNWRNVAKRTEVVYRKVAAMRIPSLGSRLVRYSTVGPWAGPAVCFLVALLHIMWRICERIWPAHAIEKCPDLPTPRDLLQMSSVLNSKAMVRQLSSDEARE